MDFFEALGFKHYQAREIPDDRILRDLYIDRIYDTYIDEEELQTTDHTIGEIANSLDAKPISSRAFIKAMGKWLADGNAKKEGSLIEECYKHGVPIFVPAFADCSAGFGLVKHQVERMKAGKPYLSIDAVADFRELTDIKIKAGKTGLFMKRITWWPQVWLGLTFNWGVLVGYAALGGTDWIAAGLLYAAAALWTLGYDTIYACQDMEDDALVGVKSSALALGNAVGPAVGAIYGTSLALTAAAAVKAGAGLVFAPVFAAYAVHLVWQASRFRPDDGAGCLAHFRSNREAGLILLAALMLGALAPM